MLVYAALIALIISFGKPYAASMSHSLSLLTESAKSKTASMWLFELLR